MADLVGGLSTSALNGIGVVALVVLFAFAIAKDWLIPGHLHRRTIEAKDAEIARVEKDKDAQIAAWREVAATESLRADVVTQQNTELISGAHTAVDVIKALRSVAEQRAQEAE